MVMMMIVSPAFRRQGLALLLCAPALFSLASPNPVPEPAPAAAAAAEPVPAPVPAPAPSPAPEPYIVTSYFRVQTSTFDDGFTDTALLITYAPILETNTVWLSAPASLPSSAVRRTIVSEDRYESLLTHVVIELAPDVSARPITADDAASFTNPTDYYVQLTFTDCADASPGQSAPAATVTTRAFVDVPSEAKTLITPTSTIVGAGTASATGAGDFDIVSALVDPSDVDPGQLSSISARLRSAACPAGLAAAASSSPTSSAADSCATARYPGFAGCGNDECCADCDLETEICIGNACPPVRSWLVFECHDGNKFYPEGGDGARARGIAAGLVWAVAGLWCLNTFLGMELF